MWPNPKKTVQLSFWKILLKLDDKPFSNLSRGFCVYEYWEFYYGASRQMDSSWIVS